MRAGKFRQARAGFRLSKIQGRAAQTLHRVSITVRALKNIIVTTAFYGKNH
jgi:hypothetical protein